MIQPIRINALLMSSGQGGLYKLYNPSDGGEMMVVFDVTIIRNHD